jgi:hypothetical protein
MNAIPFFAFYDGEDEFDAVKHCKDSIMEKGKEFSKDYDLIRYKDVITIIPYDEWCPDLHPSKEKALKFAKRLISINDDRISNKYKQLAVIEYHENRYLIFGWMPNE